jgi:surface protein
MGLSSMRNTLVRGYAAFFSAFFTGNMLLVSAAVRQTPSSGPYYVAPNGVTVMCPGVKVGDTFDINDLTYTKVDEAMLQSLVDYPNTWPQLATSCTTGVKDMESLFSYGDLRYPVSFNGDISSWDTSSVTNMNSMFMVRVPPSRVLLLLRRFLVVVLARPLAPR